MSIPSKVEYAIIGAGIHGLSTAWHLAAKLKAKGKGDGSKILVIDKSLKKTEEKCFSYWEKGKGRWKKETGWRDISQPGRPLEGGMRI